MLNEDVTRSSANRRPRILFVDDQREVATTLAALLTSDGAECRFANDGETGLSRLMTEVFDLAVLDLRMPPGGWGGLWLLRELSRRGLTVDTLVLSGEAGQFETIEALRLGAHDFVVKDNASSELGDRVRGALNFGANARADFAARQLPTPVALPFQRMQVPQDGEARLRAALATVEAVIRFSALAAIAVARADDSPFDRSLLNRLARPSLGTWRERFAVICGRKFSTMRSTDGSASCAQRTRTPLCAIGTMLFMAAAPRPVVWTRRSRTYWAG